MKLPKSTLDWEACQFLVISFVHAGNYTAVAVGTAMLGSPLTIGLTAVLRVWRMRPSVVRTNAK